MSFSVALRYTLGRSSLVKDTFFFFICTFTSEPVKVTIPRSCPEVACVATKSPICKGSPSEFLKYSFLEFLKRTSTQSNGASPAGRLMLESQSKTVNLLQLSVPQVPLLLQPRGCPSAPVAQLLQPIYFIFSKPGKDPRH